MGMADLKFAKLRSVDTGFKCHFSQDERYTVVTLNKGQSIFGEIGSNKGISQIPLFVIFDKWYEIKGF